MTVDSELEQAIEAVWAIPPPGPDNLLSQGDFVAAATLGGQHCAVPQFGPYVGSCHTWLTKKGA